MTKEEIGKQIEALRKECWVSTYELEKKGIHPSLPATIEKGQKGYSIDLQKMMTRKESELLLDEMHNVYANILASCHNPDFFQGYKLRQQMRHRYHYVRHCVRSSFYPDTRLSYNDTFKRISDILKSGYGNNPNGNEEQ